MAYDLVARLKLVDGMTGPLRKVKRQIDDVTKTTASVTKATATYTSATTKMTAAGGRYVSTGGKVRRELTLTEKALKSAGNAFTSLERKVGRGIKWGAIGLGAAAVGAAGFAVGSSVKKAMDFESQLASIQALTGINNAGLAKMQSLALVEGARTQYSALEAGQAIEALIKAGMETADVMGGGLRAALDLATAGGLDLTEAAETMSTSMNAFRKDGLSAAEIANVLAGTANAAATDVHGLGYALASAGGIADQFGVSFKDFNTVIGLMSNDGLKNGSDAGTSFKSMLMYLQPQTKKATQMFKALGLGVGKTNKFFENGKIKDVAGIAEQLYKTFSKFNDQTRGALFLDIFGTDGVKAAASLYKAGAKGVEQFREEMSKVTALDVAKRKMNTAAGAVEQFRGALETLQISALLPTMPLIKDFANWAAEGIEKYSPQITKSAQAIVAQFRSFLDSAYLKNPEFLKLDGLKAKVSFVFDDIMTRFNDWYGGGGSTKIAAMGTKITDMLAQSLKASEPLIEAATKIGVSIGAGILQGILSDPTMMALLGGYLGAKGISTTPGKGGGPTSSSTTPKTGGGKSQVPTGGAIIPYVGQAMALGSIADALAKYPKEWGVELAKALGYREQVVTNAPLNKDVVDNLLKQPEFILSNGYLAHLPKVDERLQTLGTQIANQKPAQVTVTGNTFQVRKESDIDAIAHSIAKQIAW
ncbi:phage tail tape measure protein [Paenibacillus humicus]|uniref:phage tail tape measure protein n=1 Tax=Paenibacillus humicus TaxID=412861 RepID=UPI0013E37CE4|nr:phage tail tape measure protein [Paenibacillus humicus]